jgi:hypothetical protein
VAVELVTGAVVAAGGAGVGVAGEVLGAAQVAAGGVEDLGDGGVPQRVRRQLVGGRDTGVHQPSRRLSGARGCRGHLARGPELAAVARRGA